MKLFSRKCAALLLAVWLPLFSGNALAVSVAMQVMGGPSVNGGCHEMAQINPAHQDASMPQYVHHADHLAQQHSSHKDCGVCQLACCGYMAAVTIEIPEAPSFAQSFTPAATQFKSFTSAPLDPPPLARV